MNTPARIWLTRALGLVALVGLAACTVSGEGYVAGYYEPPGYEYGVWHPRYYVAPPRGEYHGGRSDDHHDRGAEHQPAPAPPPRAYRPAPSSRPAPSIPNRPAPPGHGHDKDHR